MVLYSHDSVGLGHVRRNLPLAHALSNQLPGLTGRPVTGLLITGTSLAPAFHAPEGWDWVLLPGVAKSSAGYQPRDLGTDGNSAPGLLDFDESCQAEPALDLANLDVHLELRRLQNRLTLRRYVIAHSNILAAAEELRVSPERFAAYAACTRLRLLCVYSFRPLWGFEAARYLSQAPQGDRKNAQLDEGAVPEWSLR